MPYTQESSERRTASVPGQHESRGGPLRSLLFLLIWIPGSVVTTTLAWSAQKPALLGFGPVFFLLLAAYASRVVRVAAQWERGVILRLGRFHGLKGPGLILVFPVADTVQFVDTRLLTMEIPHQQVITRDNVPVNVDGVIFFTVQDPEKAIVTVQDYRYAIGQYSQAALRDVIGSMALDELLSERDEIQAKIAQVVESRGQAWGIHVDSIRLLDIDMPEDLKRMMSRQASAEREKRATITKAEGDAAAALNLASAAQTMHASPGAMQLRTLQTLDGLGASSSNTVVMALPLELMEFIKKVRTTD